MLLGGTDWRGSRRKEDQWGDRQEEERSPDSQLSVLPLLPLTPLSTAGEWPLRKLGEEDQLGWRGRKASRAQALGLWEEHRGKTRDRQIEPHEIAISVDQK